MNKQITIIANILFHTYWQINKVIDRILKFLQVTFPKQIQ